MITCGGQSLSFSNPGPETAPKGVSENQQSRLTVAPSAALILKRSQAAGSPVKTTIEKNSGYATTTMEDY